MNTTYTSKYCLGHNKDQFSPQIEHYASWEELAKFCKDERSNGIIKDKLPGFTYKGDYSDKRDEKHFRGDRSEYVVVDIDFDENLNKMTKDEAKSNPLILFRIRDCVEIMVNGLCPGYFFLKRSTSSCGLHIVVRLTDMPADLEEAKRVERMVFKSFQAMLDDTFNCMEGFYKFSVDFSLQSTSRVFFASHDPNLIYNPDYKKISAKSPELIEPIKVKKFTKRSEPTPDDAKIFEEFCIRSKEQGVRVQYLDVFKMSIIYHQIFPSGTEDHFLKLLGAYNFHRAKSKPYGVIKFLKNMYYKMKDADSKVGMTTLYKMAGVKRANSRSKKIDDLYTKIFKNNELF